MSFNWTAETGWLFRFVFKFLLAENLPTFTISSQLWRREIFWWGFVRRTEQLQNTCFLTIYNNYIHPQPSHLSRLGLAFKNWDFLGEASPGEQNNSSQLFPHIWEIQRWWRNLTSYIYLIWEKHFWPIFSWYRNTFDIVCEQVENPKSFTILHSSHCTNVPVKNTISLSIWLYHTFGIQTNLDGTPQSWCSSSALISSSTDCRAAPCWAAASW